MHCCGHLQSHIVSNLYYLISRIRSSFLSGLKACSLIQISRHIGPLSFHRRTYAPSSHLLCSFLPLLQRTQPSVIQYSYLELGVLYAAPSVIQLYILVISFCPVESRTLCAARSSAILCLRTTFGPSFVNWPGHGLRFTRILGLHGFPPCSHST